MAEAVTTTGTRRRRFGIRFWLALLVGLLVVYYVGGALLIQNIADDTTFGENIEVPEGASRAVAVTADLVEREIDQNRWTPNDPFFLPAGILDNMPNFQTGLIGAVSRFAVELADQLARARGSSALDPDLDIAAGRLRFPPDVWIVDPRVSWAPTASSEQNYRQGMQALRAYNARLATGAAVFERRGDNLQAVVDRFAGDLGSMSAAVHDHIQNRAWLAFDADDLYYVNKGRMYAYFLILRALGQDYAAVIAERQLGNVWQEMVTSFAIGAGLQPWVVMDGAPDGQFVPSHLAAQGFYLLRARTQLREVSAVLLR